MLLPILTQENKKLYEKSQEVSREKLLSADFKKFIKDMAETMRIKDGVGLAGPQVDARDRLFVIAKEYNIFDKNKELVIINPVWKKAGLFKIWDEEGCLSVPNIFGEVKRYKKIKVTGWDENGKDLDFTASDFLARIIQHETDHLDGVLFISKAKKLRRVEKKD